MKTLSWHIGSKIKIKFLFLFLLALALLSDVFAAADTNIYRQRRDRVRDGIGIEGKAILFSGVGAQGLDKNFYYLTGIKEMNVLLVVFPMAGEDYLFFPDAHNADKVQLISRISGIVRIMPMKEFDTVFGYLYSWQQNVYYPIPTVPGDYSYDLILRIVNKYPQFKLKDLFPILAEMRMIKSTEEVAIMKRTVEITAAGISAAMLQAKPGMYEYELQNILESTFQSLGAEGTSFHSIIGSGPNSVIVHYDLNTRKMESGDLVVMDVGAEYSEYAGDITRTIPVSGKFSARQKEIYEIVLEAQRRALEVCRPGVTLAYIDSEARGFLSRMGYGAYSPYRTCHSLGLDVHDLWFNPATLVPNMIITVEPGIYLAAENLGVRIEDDVLVTENGCVVLSSAVPKEPQDIEHLIQGKMDDDDFQKGWKPGKKPEPRVK